MVRPPRSYAGMGEGATKMRLKNHGQSEQRRSQCSQQARAGSWSRIGTLDRLKGTPINILLVDLPALLRDAVRGQVRQLPDAQVGEVDLATLHLLAGCRQATTAVVWAGSHDGARWEPGRTLLAPGSGLRVLRVDEPGESAVLFEMRPTAEVLHDVGLDALLEIVSRDE